MEGRPLLDIVAREDAAAVLELLAREDQALLVGRDALLVLDLGLDVVDRVRRLDLEGDRLAGERLDEDLHATAEAEHEVEGRLLLDVAVREGVAVLELLAREDQALLVGRDALIVLDQGLDDVQHDGEGEDEDEGDAFHPRRRGRGWRRRGGWRRRRLRWWRRR